MPNKPFNRNFIKIKQKLKIKFKLNSVPFLLKLNYSFVVSCKKELHENYAKVSFFAPMKLSKPHDALIFLAYAKLT